MRASSLSLLPIALAALPACNEPAYYDGFERLEIDDAVVNEIEHPLLGAWVQSEYWLDFSPPTAAELRALRPEGAEPAGQTPWVRREDLELSISWRLENRSDDRVTAWVLLDGATEFYDWNSVEMYGMAGGEDADEIPFPSLLGFTPLTLEANEVRHGEFREDDTLEAAFDLDVMTRFCGGPLALLYNRSEVDPVGTQGKPDDAILAGMVMLRLTLGASAPARLDYSIRLRDREGILYDRRRDDVRWETMPQPYVPAGFAQVPAGTPDPGMESAFCMAMDPPPP